MADLFFVDGTLHEPRLKQPIEPLPDGGRGHAQGGREIADPNYLSYAEKLEQGSI